LSVLHVKYGKGLVGLRIIAWEKDSNGSFST
jgi:hypothetical protein